MMTRTNRRVERRAHERFQVPVGVFVGFRPDNTRLGEIIDISLSGLSFRYLASGGPSNGSRRLKIFLAERGFCLDDLPFETVSDVGIYEIPFTPVTMRRSGVQFERLTEGQVSRLEYFIQHFTLSKA
jgi:hypothetical protein